MADEVSSPASQHRDGIKFSGGLLSLLPSPSLSATRFSFNVFFSFRMLCLDFREVGLGACLSANNIAAQRRRKNAISLGKERREVLIRTKRMCREGPADYNGTSLEIDMVVDEEKAILDSQASKVVEDLKSALRLHYIFDVNDILVKSTMAFSDIHPVFIWSLQFPDFICDISLPKNRGKGATERKVLPACYAKSFPDALCHSSSLYRRHLRPWAIPVTTSRTAAVLVNETRTFLPLFFRCLQRQEA
ncbi:Importin subunit alpha-2 [Platanthera guangdongensis]|uniref:Importin subunit alpha-2 n=1 Tax=Platanthera guangdongensis TaxID=2320717 RepID=A0ABR2M8R6_9ASPA